MKNWILILWCLFVVGDYAYIINADRHLPVCISEVYISEAGNCVYKVYHRRSGHRGEYKMYYYSDFYDLRYEKDLMKAKNKDEWY